MLFGIELRFVDVVVDGFSVRIVMRIVSVVVMIVLCICLLNYCLVVVFGRCSGMCMMKWVLLGLFLMVILFECVLMIVDMIVSLRFVLFVVWEWDLLL